MIFLRIEMFLLSWYQITLWCIERWATSFAIFDSELIDRILKLSSISLIIVLEMFSRSMNNQILNKQK